MTDSKADASAKAVLRQQARAARQAFVRAHPEADWLAGDLAERMLAGLGRTIPGWAAIYRASGSEIDPRPLGETLAGQGWRLALPACEQLAAPVVFRAWSPGDRMAPDAAGVAAPLAGAATVTPDLIIAPVIAFDRAGGRLGQGAGFYDRTLAVLRKAAVPPAFVGLAFSVQEAPRVPMQDHDQRLDGILTEKEFIAVRKDL